MSIFISLLHSCLLGFVIATGKQAKLGNFILIVTIKKIREFCILEVCFGVFVTLECKRVYIDNVFAWVSLFGFLVMGKAECVVIYNILLLCNTDQIL